MSLKSLAPIIVIASSLFCGASNAAVRYGPLACLEEGSTYGQYWFPEPLRADEADVDNELRADYFHAEGHGSQQDQVKLELEKSFELFTFEIAPRYEVDRSASFDPRTRSVQRQRQEGFINIEVGGRFPFFQYVSPSRSFDTTFVFGMEASPPSGSTLSRDFELVPKLFNLTRLGEHVSLQIGVGNSVLVGPVGDGLSTLEYDAVFGYELTRQELPLPGVLSTVPIFELDGEYVMNQRDAGNGPLTAVAGVRINFISLPGIPAQPRFGIGYEFPVDRDARRDLRWGTVTSLIFEY